MENNRGPLAWIDRASDLLGAVAALGMAGMFLLMIAEIFTRGVLGFSLGVTWELSGYLMGLVVFLGSARALRAGSHVRIMLLLETLPKRYTKWIDVLATALGALIVGYIVKALHLLAMTSYTRGTVSSTPEQFPLFVPQALLCLGATMLLLQLLARLVTVVRQPAERIAAPSRIDGGHA